jgi:hypothetical protein
MAAKTNRVTLGVTPFGIIDGIVEDKSFFKLVASSDLVRYFIVFLLQLEFVFGLSRLTESCSKSGAAGRRLQLRATFRWPAIRKECPLAFAAG